MPVSFSPSRVAGRHFELGKSSNISPSELFGRLGKGQPQKAGELFQSSFPQSIIDIHPNSNGLVNTIVQAYNKHHALVLRPDDVWIGILTQFNFFVNANAETLRSHFVAHKGKKELVVETSGSRYTVDFGDLAIQMTRLIEKNVVDPSLRDWILPDFSTTTLNDTTVSAIVMMATMKAYFTYVINIACGIPRVTLEGEKSDWEKILHRLEKLKEYGLQTIAWYHLLVPVISRFIKAFDDPTSIENIEFWGQAAHYTACGSGPDYISGWVSAFCVFSHEGKWLGADFKNVRLYVGCNQKI